MTIIFQQRYNFFLITIFILGLILRIYLARLAYPDLIWDMASYNDIAGNIVKGQIFTDCCDKNPGYPLFLAANYKIFGVENLAAIKHVQVGMDMITCVLVFLVARRLFSLKTAFLAFVIYALNPIVASFTGFILPETITLLFMGLAAFIMTHPLFKKNILLIVSWGFVLGFMALQRFSLVPFGIFIILLFGIIFFKKSRMIFLILAFSGFFLANSYSLIANWKMFKKIDLTPPYKPGVINFYLSFYLGKYPELISEYPQQNRHFYDVNLEYHTTWYTGIDAVKNKYKILFWQKMRTEWPDFIKNTLKNMWHIWQKRFLFTYKDPFYPADSMAIRVYNLGLVFSFLFGLISFILQKKQNLFNPLSVFSLLLFFYITFVFTLISNETRHSLIFYSLMPIWSAYGLRKIYEKKFNA